MTRLRVRFGRWLARDVAGVDLGDLDEAGELFDLAVERLELWAETDRDPEDFARAYDVGTLCAFISTDIKLTTRTVLSDAIDNLLNGDDVDPLAAIRLVELRTVAAENGTELPEVDQ